jgi:alkylation response protein AidB-like acyl-CoA dehydrogenase
VRGRALNEVWSGSPRAATACDLTLDEVRIPKAYMVGDKGEGFRIAMEQLDQGRIGIAAHAVGTHLRRSIIII